MAYLITIADLKTHIHEEEREEITREDQGIAEQAIQAAISEAKGFMNKYELPALFGTETTDPTISDFNLKFKVKDLVKWYLVLLGVPDIDYDDAETRYKYAIDNYFKLIQSGKITPEGWPFHDTTTDPKPPEGDEIFASSNRKRRQHF